MIEAAVEQTGHKAVILIDEYDAPMHDSMKDEDLQDEIRNIMRGFFSPLKSEEDNLQFVFMTGISKFSQLSIFSEINNLDNISMFDEYSVICGISKTELLDDMKPDVELLPLYLSIGLYGSAFFECFRMFPLSSLMITLAYFLF